MSSTPSLLFTDSLFIDMYSTKAKGSLNGDYTENRNQVLESCYVDFQLHLQLRILYLFPSFMILFPWHSKMNRGATRSYTLGIKTIRYIYHPHSTPATVGSLDFLLLYFFFFFYLVLLFLFLSQYHLLTLLQSSLFDPG